MLARATLRPRNDIHDPLDALASTGMDQLVMATSHAKAIKDHIS